MDPHLIHYCHHYHYYHHVSFQYFFSFYCHIDQMINNHYYFYYNYRVVMVIWKEEYLNLHVVVIHVLVMKTIYIVMIYVVVVLLNLNSYNIEYANYQQILDDECYDLLILTEFCPLHVVDDMEWSKTMTHDLSRRDCRLYCYDHCYYYYDHYCSYYYLFVVMVMMYDLNDLDSIALIRVYSYSFSDLYHKHDLDVIETLQEMMDFLMSVMLNSFIKK
mmetsp:Transcript_36778/g.32485  ORF Transcript_36778/g.32485 Transcript_36778/m.32485 type:complete len:217 (+) Transcript_36778:472-1122(+)